MATLYDTSALKALNERDYINKLYDSNNDTTKQLLQQNYTDNTGVLATEQNKVQQQTQENVNRTQVEAAHSCCNSLGVSKKKCALFRRISLRKSFFTFSIRAVYINCHPRCFPKSRPQTAPKWQRHFRRGKSKALSGSKRYLQYSEENRT